MPFLKKAAFFRLLTSLTCSFSDTKNMNIKLITLFLLTAFSSILFSACTSVESKNSEEEVVIGNTAKSPSGEVTITDSDLQKKDKQIVTSYKSVPVPKKTLPDKSEIVTGFDGYGSKIEKRSFNDNPRLRFVLVLTAVDGTQTVTVYGYGANVKIIYNLTDPLTASADQIADAAQITATRDDLPSNYSFPKTTKSGTKEALKPLSSSQFPTADARVKTSPESVQTETNGAENSPK